MAHDWTERGWNDKECKAVIFRDGDHSWVLYYVGGDIDFEINEAVSSRDAEDLGLDPPGDGISIWEGRYRYSRDGGYHGDDFDSDPHGEFRRPTDEEWASIRAGEAPWDVDEWRTPEFLAQEQDDDGT